MPKRHHRSNQFIVRADRRKRLTVATAGRIIGIDSPSAAGRSRLGPRSSRRQAALLNRAGRGSSDAPTWLDYRLDLVRGRSDAPRIPTHQVERLFPEGAPRSWELLIERPQRPVWVMRAAGALISIVLGAVAVLSPTVAGVAATVGAGLGEMLSIAGHVLHLAGADGVFGLIGRVATVVAISIPLARLGWRATRWGVAPIGGDR